MKKFFAILLTLALVLSFATVVSAADEQTVQNITNNNVNTSGSITINGVSASNNTYAIYKILHLESYNVTSKVYSYKIENGWEGFFATEDALKYVAIANSYVTWVAGEDDATVAAFAKLALAYAQAHGIQPLMSSANEGEFVVTDGAGKFSNLTLGYYLVDSTVGALCGLSTTNPNASINAKNGAPTLDKQVQEDSTGNWGKTNSADMGQTIKFRTTISVHAGAQNYVLHDKFAAGISFEGITGIHHVVPGITTEEGTVVPDEYYTVNTAPTDGCTFEIAFTQAFCDHLQTNDKVIVFYDGALNASAKIGTNENKNEIWLNFGEGNITATDFTTSYTYGIDIIKTDSQNTLIDGAEFRIYDAATGGNEIPVVKVDAETYRLADVGETGVNIVVTNGEMRVIGLDNGTYYLEEKVNPHGYNKLTARQRFIISDKNLDAIFNDDVFSVGSGVHVVNKAGTMLPETGGLGTLLFTVLGGGTALGTGVVLVTKKRMSKIEDED